MPTPFQSPPQTPPTPQHYPLFPLFFAQSGQNHAPDGASLSPTHSLWNHSMAQFFDGRG
ncbi:hypothetical protein BDK51DRAFT_38305, partial [Blyttiomyces helicus]